MPFLGAVAISTGYADPKDSLAFASANDSGDYFTKTLSTPHVFSGKFYGQVFIKDASNPDASIKNILTYTDGTNTLYLRQDHAPNGSYTIIIDYNGSQFETPVIAAGVNWRWLYFYVDFEAGTGIFYLNNSSIGFDTSPAPASITPVDFDSLSFVEVATYTPVTRFARIWCDFDSTVTQEVFESITTRRSFARITQNAISPRYLGTNGQLPFDNIPDLYMSLKSSVTNDASGSDFTLVGINRVVFNNDTQIICPTI